MKFDYKKIIRDYVEWIEDDKSLSESFSARHTKKIITKLETAASEGDSRVLGQELSYLANWHARRGVVLFSQGDSNGWLELCKTAQYEFWNIRISSRSYDRLGIKFNCCFTANILGAGKCGILCFALNAWPEAAWMAQRLQQSRTDESIRAWQWELAVPRLVIALQRCLDGRTDMSDLELGVYRKLFDHWNDPVELKKTLLNLADYHVENLKDKGKESIGEFARPPVDIFPAEMIAIQRVREKLGLDTPAIDHPLMKTPFANPPKELHPEPDELLIKVLDKVRTIIPDL